MSLQEYQVGTNTFVQMIDNWRQLLRQQIMLQQQESQLHQTLATLAATVGSYDLRTVTPELPSPTTVIPSTDGPPQP